MAVAAPDAEPAPDAGRSANLIELCRVTKTYRKGGAVISVLDRVNLRIPAGRFLSVVGPSGSGKSTLLHLLGGLDTADSGEVRVAGARLSEMSERDRTVWRSRSVGFVFQQYHLIPVLTAGENVDLPLRLFRMDRRERRRRVAHVLDLVDLSDRCGHRPAQLSGGQEQRVAIARAVVTDPPLILADEPTGDLDADSAAQVMGLLALLSREMGKTIVMVTHDPRAAAFSSQRHRLDRGTLQELPPADDGFGNGRPA